LAGKRSQLSDPAIGGVKVGLDGGEGYEMSQEESPQGHAHIGSVFEDIQGGRRTGGEGGDGLAHKSAHFNVASHEPQPSRQQDAQQQRRRGSKAPSHLSKSADGSKKHDSLLFNTFLDMSADSAGAAASGPLPGIQLQVSCLLKCVP